jgi:hypothetical protein
VDTAQLIVEAVMPKEAVDRSEKALEIALKECLGNGLTSLDTAGEPVRLIELLKRFHDQGKLSVRGIHHADGRRGNISSSGRVLVRVQRPIRVWATDYSSGQVLC